MSKRLAILVVAILGVTHVTLAQTNESVNAPANNASIQTSTQEIKTEVPAKKWNIEAAIETSTNLNETSDYDKSFDNAYSLIPSLKISEKLRISAVGVFIHNLKQAEESDFKNTDISLSHSAIELIKEQLSIAPAIKVTLPTNRIDREERSLITALGVSQSLSLSLKKQGLPATVIYGLGLRKNVHEWDRTNLGTPNFEYAFINSIGVGVDINDKLSFTTKGLLYSNLTYQGEWRSRFEIFEEVGYAISEAASVYIGHTNAAPTLKEDMNSSNIEVFNKYTSSVYAGVGMTY